MSSNRKRTLILASSSPRRQELIRSLQLPYIICVSDADETISHELTPPKIVETLSLRKAQAAAEKLAPEQREGIVIGSDTIVVLNGRILGKPNSEEEAVDMLLSLQGNTHEVYSGVACVDLDQHVTKVNHSRTKVLMKPLTKEQVVRYVATGEPMDKAGSYAIQGLGATIVQSIEGCYFNVVGLPLSLLSTMLEDLGVEVL